MARGILIGVMLCVSPALASATVGTLESPSAHEEVPQTGIATIFGWHCTARDIQVRIDDGPPMKAVTGVSRKDTASTCQRTDTGFSLLYNYNQLPIGLHTVTVTANGREFARRRVLVQHFGEGYLAGRGGYVRFRNFPEPGAGGRLIWDEERQNFTLEGVYPAVEGAATGMTGTYHGAIATQCPGMRSVSDVRYARFDVEYPTDEQIAVVVTHADGERCSIAGFREAVDMDRQIFGRLTSDCVPGRSVALTLQIDGQRIDGVLGDTAPVSSPFECGKPRVFFATREGFFGVD